MVMIDEKFIEAANEAQKRLVADFRSKPCEQCPGCGRRSSSMIGDLCRNCYFSKIDPDERPEFEAMCARHAVKMMSREIYLRRRKNILHTVAIDQDHFYSHPKDGNKEEAHRLYLRFMRTRDHLYLLDEIWNYLHPIPMDWVSGSWGKSFEVGAAVDAIKEGRFDSFCEELHMPRRLRKES
jgi:hypothetical protein